jgi:hypothetical protein
LSRKSEGRFGGFLSQPALEGRPGNPQTPGSLALGQASDPAERFRIDPTSGPSEPLTLRPGPRQPRPNAFHDTTPFEFSDGPEDLHLETTGRRGGVDALGEADERDAERLEFFEQRDQVFARGAEASGGAPRANA